MEESKKLIEAYSYNFTEFYGLIFCYLNHYNYEDFMELFNKLDKSMENKKDLFEILLIYKHFFKKKIKFEKNFLEKFIIYSTENKDNNEKEENKKTNDKKHFLRFIEKALPYLDEINFYIHTININKEKIILIKDFQPIEITKFENYSNNFEETERDIDDILNFSKDKKILVIYFNNDFWSNIIKLYDEATQDNIKILKKLKILFEKYYTIVENVCKIKLIKTKASEFKDKDELSIKLDKIIIEYIKNKNDIENDEIVNLLVDFNPFYDLKDNQESYINKRKELEEYFLLWTHQIKTPITVSKLLFRTYENAQTKALEEQMFYIEEYTNMAMNYIKLIDRNADMDITYVDLDEIIKVVLKKYAMLFIDKKISLNYEPIHQLVIADSKWLSIMIEQLIANAVKYTNEGSITISYNKQTRQLAIKDTGIGIREEDIPKIFDRGYSGFNGRLNEKSSGLGLYLVRKIALLLNIEIDVDSKLNVGSTFSLKFPANLTNL